MKYQLLFCILMILLCGCGNEKKGKIMSYTQSVDFQDGCYWITGAVRDDDLAVIVIREKRDLLNQRIFLTYIAPSQNDNIVLRTESVPDITIKPGMGGIYYIKENGIELYKKDMTPEFLSLFFRDLERDQTHDKFKIAEFCSMVGADLTPIQMKFSDLQ